MGDAESASRKTLKTMSQGGWRDSLCQRLFCNVTLSLPRRRQTISQAPCRVHDTLTVTTQKKEPTPALEGDVSNLVDSAFCLLNVHL